LPGALSDEGGAERPRQSDAEHHGKIANLVLHLGDGELSDVKEAVTLRPGIAA
jgi:hypothetical protein